MAWVRGTEHLPVEFYLLTSAQSAVATNLLYLFTHGLTSWKKGKTQAVTRQPFLLRCLELVGDKNSSGTFCQEPLPPTFRPGPCSRPALTKNTPTRHLLSWDG